MKEPRIVSRGTCATGAIRVYVDDSGTYSVYLVIEHSGSSGPEPSGRTARSYILHSTFDARPGTIEEHDEHAVWFMYSRDYA
jgi:hypothetical protein